MNPDQTTLQSEQFGPAGLGFQIHVNPDSNRTLIRLTGNLGNDASAPLRTAALRVAEYQRRVAIDWEAAEYLGIGAIQSLLALTGALPRPAIRLTVCRDCGEIRSLLELAGLSGFFPFEPEDSSRE